MMAVVLAVGGFAFACPCAQAQFTLGLRDMNFFSPNGPGQALSTIKAIDGSWIKIDASWLDIGPAGTRMPAGFKPSNPGDPQYNWAALDNEIRSAAKWHLHVMLDLWGAPDWALGPNRPNNPNINFDAWDPSPVQFGLFARAAALRYSGHFPDPLHPGINLPRVNDWEIWNEENLPIYLAAPDLVGEYRALLNAAYGAIKGVAQSNVVAVGGLAPVSYLPPLSVSPLKFAAQLMCLRRVGTSFVRERSCSPPRFDAFADHPYTLAATPTKHAYHYDDVLVGDLGKLTGLLHAAQRLHVAASSVRLWVTEWAWFTEPPNKLVGDANATAARYVAYSMYEMWRSGVQMVIWSWLQDDPRGSSSSTVLGGGLYFASGRAKLALRAFAFPFVASVNGRSGFVWGRAPVSQRVRVVVQHLVGKRWQQVATATTHADGVLLVALNVQRNGLYRAHVVGGPSSLAYDAKPIPPKRTHLFYSG
jgi:hypothetical protein